jgi:hypothetical protein
MSVTTVAEFTASEKILLAAYQLEERGQSPFSAENLIVAAWQEYPRTFGLKGYDEQFPDSNRVLSCIMGEKGLAKRGWLAKMGQKMYSLTREGRQVVRRLQGGGEPEAAEPVRVSHGQGQKLGRDQEKYLQTVLSSSAVKKYQEGQKDELTFADACRFWGITENLHGDALNSRLNRLLTSLSELKESIGARGVELGNGRHVTLDDLLAIGDIHEYLEGRFTRHLNLLRNRAGRN